MNQRYQLVVIQNVGDSGFTAYYPDLPGCITCADTWEELQYMTEDAKKCRIEVAPEDLDEIPELAPVEKVA